jgi:hypothetical protein
VYLNLEELRQSPFLAELFRWAPQVSRDPDYARFIAATGFDYERDLNRVAIAVLERDPDSAIFAVAQGKFDEKKINSYAAKNGAKENRDGHEIFSVPQTGGAHTLSFTFLRKDRLALTNDSNLPALLVEPQADTDADAWRERFRRLAGSPFFVVTRQGSAATATLNSHAPGGLQSPQVSALLNQLQWITVGAKPEEARLRIVVEGETPSDSVSRQLRDVLNGVLQLAQAGLAGPSIRQQLQPQVREAYLELLKSADVSQIDRGDTKAVRLMFDVTPQFLEAVRPTLTDTLPDKTAPGKHSVRN